MTFSVTLRPTKRANHTSPAPHGVFWEGGASSLFYSAIFNTYAAKLAKEAFEKVLKDDSFKLKTGFTSYVLSSATTILSQCGSAVFVEFSNQLVSSPQKCIPRACAKEGTISKVQ